MNSDIFKTNNNKEGFRVLREGASSLGVGKVRRTPSAFAVDTRIPCL